MGVMRTMRKEGADVDCGLRKNTEIQPSGSTSDSRCRELHVPVRGYVAVDALVISVNQPEERVHANDLPHELATNAKHIDMYPLHPPGPALRKSNSQNIAARSNQQGTVRHRGGCRYTLPRSKASATVSLTNASANASCITASAIPPVDPFSSPPSPRPRSTRTNVIPFPSSSPHDTAMQGPSVPELASDIGLNDALSRYQQQQPYRRKRSPPQQHHSRPHWNTHPTPNPNIRKHPNSSPRQSRESAPAKRPRRNKRVVADLQFVALVHRSIVNRVRESGVNINVYPDDGDGERMRVDDANTDHKILFEQEDLLLRRLWTTLVEHGYGSEYDFQRVRFVDPDADLDSEAETSSSGMDADSSEVLRFPLLPPGLALPSTHPPFPSLTPPTTTPTPSNSPNPNSTNPAKVAQVLSMAQLVAALIMRSRYRPTGREREREKERGEEKSRRPPPPLATVAGSGIGSSLFGRWKESFSLGATVIGVDISMGAARGRNRSGGGGGAPLDTVMNIGDIAGGNGKRVERRRSSPLSISVFTAADSGWSSRWESLI
ncbi:hypothetical protein PILCRDRAFT_89859 [Piloderma croceum F 1598]|uniref:Uncharacterized protein n=1 Tax=Piloderma croceum (strain F 1598) TaxID=765440 RepID=A0A0C3BRS0_PILCF|nr:hypothetical protein PILCRDRAFT_89859 [Piloderma croceum F 1598]